MNIGALGAVEDEREAVRRLDPEKDEPGLMPRIEADAADVDPFGGEDVRTKRPSASSPTRVSIPLFRPSLRVPTEMFAGHPPTYFAKLFTSSRGTPTCSA